MFRPNSNLCRQIKKAVFVPILALLAFLAACGKKSPPPVILSPPATPASQAPAPIEKPPISPAKTDPLAAEPRPAPTVEPDVKAIPPVPGSFLDGEEKFNSGDYEGAASNYQEFLKDNPSHVKSGEACFKLGLAYAFSGDSAQSQRRAREQFRLLIREFPDSPFRPEAEYLLRLQADIDKLRSDAREKDKEIERLTKELERLKRIDLNRRPTRPPY